MQTTDTQSITAPTKELTTKTIWRIVMVCLIVFVTMSLCSIGIIVKKNTGKSKYITITTTEWIPLETNGKDLESQILPINGIKPKYFISVNDTLHPIELPTDKEVKLGRPEDISVLYLCLKPGQEYRSATLIYKFK